MALIAVGAAAGCGGESAADLDATVTSWSLSTEDSIALAEDDKYVTPADEFQIGQTLTLTDAGPVPRTLVVIRERELTIRNDGAAPRTLTFVNASVDGGDQRTLGPIDPGASMTYVPTVPISMAYDLDGDGAVDGTLQVDTGEFSG